LDNQHQKIAGYRDLSQEEIDDMNALKAKEAEMGEILARIDARCAAEDREAGRWSAMARTNLETGFMYAIKAVARPTNGLGRKGS